ncbi:MAG: hypothetical protein QOH62_2874 [Solirubrobacteraceae bacterium]|jgi:hypothetical protein|nr:hypothetical protein [Solirubrobacteraceae bacterium]
MSAVRSIISDLVDRRLWPVALALVAALVAVPVLLGGSSAPAPAPAAPIANAAAAGGTAQAAISVSTPETGRKDRPGPVRNPFVQHQVKSPSSTSGAPATGATAPPTGGAPPSLGGGTPTVIPPTGPSAPAAPTPPPVKDVWRVNLRFGEAGNQSVHHNVLRLTPLPSATDPFFVFMGVLADGKTAVFLVSSDATATGDGKCKPSKTQCDTVEMRVGDTEFFDVAQGNAGVVQYELDLLKVAHSKASATAAAKAARQVSSDGQAVVSELKAEGDKSMDRYIYSYSRGVLVRRYVSRATASASAISSNIGPSAAHSSLVTAPTWGG